MLQADTVPWIPTSFALGIPINEPQDLETPWQSGSQALQLGTRLSQRWGVALQAPCNLGEGGSWVACAGFELLLTLLILTRCRKILSPWTMAL